ncbi:uncharacterized protein BCR38DRAFT_83228 [Pseudomassariella vexata]|uniref:Uncharacterized protein n=1 Tax=Pseudomassariella vexata TaxID=1141098 RepID=A0A1Y2DDW3_9PEZI|nr:uncharacterized protein BCR38DRAFT_83228 [Pseudomassariella vexata]ORY57460.1 hypothetical protein BCR38DRAFT_83228 [Pseudomassariella vexata]
MKDFSGGVLSVVCRALFAPSTHTLDQQKGSPCFHSFIANGPVQISLPPECAPDGHFGNLHSREVGWGQTRCNGRDISHFESAAIEIARYSMGRERGLLFVALQVAPPIVPSTDIDFLDLHGCVPQTSADQRRLENRTNQTPQCPQSPPKLQLSSGRS